MKKALLWLALIICCVFALFFGDRKVVSAESAAVSDPKQDDIYAGLWRDGKAVFSDVPLLDVFTKFGRGYRPTQPINYSHVIHVQKNHMECQYCHSSVNKSPYATIPAVETCMGCHKNPNIKPGSPELEKLRDYFKRGEPIQWEPVNNLPEYSYFTHERHIKAGVGCQNCHGQVQKMDVVEKAASLKMGFCVSCHREKGASIDCLTCHY